MSRPCEQTENRGTVQQQKSEGVFRIPHGECAVHGQRKLPLPHHQNTKAVGGEGNGAYGEQPPVAGRESSHRGTSGQAFPVESEVHSRENKAPVGKKEMQFSVGQAPVKAHEAEQRAGNGDCACQRSDEGGQQRQIGEGENGSVRRAESSAQRPVPAGIEPGVEQRQSRQKESHEFVRGVSRMPVCHEQKKQKRHECIQHRSCRHPYPHRFPLVFEMCWERSPDLMSLLSLTAPSAQVAAGWRGWRGASCCFEY